MRQHLAGELIRIQHRQDPGGQQRPHRALAGGAIPPPASPPPVADLPFLPGQLAEMVGLIEAGSISGMFAKEFPPELLKKGDSPAALVEARGLGMISDPAAIAAIVDELLAAHPAEVEAFRGGKTKLQGFFAGQLMKKTGGKADPKLANRILAEQLKG